MQFLLDGNNNIFGSDRDHSATVGVMRILKEHLQPPKPASRS